MFGIDSPELLVIAVVALVVIGPKELPGMLRGWGKWTAKMRGMAAEFRGHVDEMVRQSELDEVKKQIVETTSGFDLKSLDPTREIKDAVREGMAEGEKALADAKDDFSKPALEADETAPAAIEREASGTVEPASAVTTPPGSETENPALSPPAAAGEEPAPPKPDSTDRDTIRSVGQNAL